jgi:hypothetical protein
MPIDGSGNPFDRNIDAFEHQHPASNIVCQQLTIKLHFATIIVAFFVSPIELPVYQAIFLRKLSNFAIGTTQG